MADPSAAFSYPSGQTELYISTGLLLIYALYQHLKQRISFSLYILMLFYLLLPMLALFTLIQQRQGLPVSEALASYYPWTSHPVSLYILIFSSAMMLWLHRHSAKSSPKGWFVLIIWSLTSWLISFSEPHTMLFLVPVNRSYYLFLIGFGLLGGITNMLLSRKEA